MTLSSAVSALQQRLKADFAEASRAGGHSLTLQQARVLEAIQAAGAEGLKQGDIVKASGVDRSTLADMLARLAKRRLVVSKRAEQDQRANIVRLTAEGARRLEAALIDLARVEEAALARSGAAALVSSLEAAVAAKPRRAAA